MIMSQVGKQTIARVRDLNIDYYKSIGSAFRILPSVPKGYTEWLPTVL